LPLSAVKLGPLSEQRIVAGRSEVYGTAQESPQALKQKKLLMTSKLVQLGNLKFWMRVCQLPAARYMSMNHNLQSSNGSTLVW
jgi:hypothetical protein